MSLSLSLSTHAQSRNPQLHLPPVHTTKTRGGHGRLEKKKTTTECQGGAPLEAAPQSTKIDRQNPTIHMPQNALKSRQGRVRRYLHLQGCTTLPASACGQQHGDGSKADSPHSTIGQRQLPPLTPCRRNIRLSCADTETAMNTDS